MIGLAIASVTGLPLASTWSPNACRLGKASISVSFVRRTALAIAALPLVLAGCTEDEPVPQSPDPTTATRSPSATESTAAPEPWEEKTEEGAIAFAQHWLGLFNDARLNGEVGPFAAANTKTCPTCANMVDLFEGWKAEGAEYESNDWTIRHVATIHTSPNKVQLGLRVFRPRERLTDGDSEVTSNAASVITYDATIVWSRTEWLMREL